MKKELMNNKQKELLFEFIEDEKRKGISSQGLGSVKRRIPKLFHYLDEIGLSAFELGVREAQDYQRWIIDFGAQINSPLEAHLNSLFTYTLLIITKSYTQ